jgi:NAD(P)-dependent dehydrogenase (short-subunit alcohol dehydrogenase family)
MLSWYGGCTVAASYEALTYRLTHVICEDVGLALGAAFQAALRDRTADGVEGSAYAFGSIDEAIAFSHVSFEGRSGSYLTRGGAAANEHVEDMLAADLGAFFEGFAQGGRVTVHVRVDRADGGRVPRLREGAARGADPEPLARRTDRRREGHAGLVMRHGGRAVVISGGTSGIGLACARRLQQEGAQVWILGTSRRTVDAALAQLPAEGIQGSVCDVADADAVDAAVDEAAAALGRIDVAVCNAGVDGQGVGALELDVAALRRVLEVNVVGVFLLARACARLMSPGSAIVVNASVNALRPEAGFLDYNVSKAGAAMVARSLALDLASRGIAVSAILPGYVPTRMTEPYLQDASTRAEILEGIPSGRLGTPEEIAGLVAYLASAEASYMTGALVTMDGGRSA